MKKHFIFLTSVFLILVIPKIAYATDLQTILKNLSKNLLVPLGGILFTAAFVTFCWGIVKYIYSLGEKEKVESRMLMFWGIIALFVMVSAWGLVRAVQTTFNITDNSPTKATNIVIP